MENNNLVLVVDDDKDCREVLVITLNMLGFPVISAVDGVEAVSLAIACRPGLIFMDLGMPNMDGYDASRAVHSHEQTRGIPIVALSANGDEPRISGKALKAGCLECWVKPFRIELILELLRRLFPDKYQPNVPAAAERQCGSILSQTKRTSWHPK